MRILDRQRYWAFLKAYFVSFVSLVGLYVVIDAFSNLDEFLKVNSGSAELFRRMGYYYLIRMSFFYDRLCGVITMLAAIFTVTWMQKNNELLAMLAAGISAKRVIVPVIISAGIVSGLAVLNQEFLIPRIGDDLQLKPDDDGTIKVVPGSRYDTNEIHLSAKYGDRADRSVEYFHALLPVSRFGSLLALEARTARYIPEDDPTSPLKGGWLLWGAHLSPEDATPDGTILIEVDADQVGQFPRPKGKASAPPPGKVMFMRSSVSFANLTRKSDWYNFASTRDLILALADPSSPAERVSVAVYLHGRIVRPLTAMILLFLSLPLVLGGEGRNMFVNLALSMGTSALFYGATFMINYLASNKVMSPELAAFLPVIAFGTLAASRWDRIRT